MSPLVSSQCWDLAVIAVILAGLLLCAIVGLCVHIRNAVLGARLRKACAGDYRTAVLEIENIRVGNEAADQAFRRGMQDTQ